MACHQRDNLSKQLSDVGRHFYWETPPSPFNIYMTWDTFSTSGALGQIPSKHGLTQVEGFATHICVTREMRADFHDAYMQH